MKGTVGIVGLGIMGGAIARNLAAAGWHVLGFDIDAGRCAAVADAGVQACADAAAVARGAPVVLFSLPSPAASLTSATAIAAAGLERRVVIEASTLTLNDKLAVEQVLRTAGHVPLDCPISGTGSQAINKDLVIYASGDAQAIAAQALLFADYARAVHDLGAYGNGSRMKFVANLLVAIHNVASAEAMALGVKAGLDPQQVVALVQAGAGTSRVFELRAPMMAERQYQPATMKVDIWQKDMAIIGQFATGLGCPTPLFSASLPVYAAAMANGHAADDTAAVYAVLEAMAGITGGHAGTHTGPE
ncbi:MAG TPA: NAD(P)-dependent oxidoreductase [Acetobacteraceae bacterium]|nr:NAD(P)-dependent oxidoreductase [Acetobacteraceae bacterium]